MKRAIQKSTMADTIGLLEAFEEFIEEKEAQNKSPKTIHNYRQTFEAFCRFNEFDRNTGIEAVTRKVFLDWVNDMAQDKSPVTVNHYLRDVRVFLYWCMDDDHHYIEKPFKMKEMSMQETKPKAFSDEDLARLMEKPNLKADFPEWRTYAIVCWIMDNGSRTETVCCAKMGDMDFKNKTITYAHTKNRKAQVVGMSDALSGILKEYILFRIQEAEERRLRLYEDYKAEILDEDEYSQLKEHYIAEKQRLEHELQKQRQRAMELEKRIKICDAQMERMRGFLNQSEFDEELVHELIKKIYVGMDNSVEVEFKCSDPYQEVLTLVSEVQNE